jgi:3-deoxy-D-manno-octulosonate 8-phosphate phosphatase (KDO 8-P phosphatase)
MKKMPANVQKLARNIRLIAMDVDGVLTGGEIIVLDSQEEIKFWNVKDRFAFHLVHRSMADIKFAWITGRKSNQVADRAKECGIDRVCQNCMKKKDALDELAREWGLKPEEVLFVGDDLVDIPPFRYAGFAVCPSDAPDEVKEEADYISSFAGGKGVLREVVEIVLKARGLWQKATEGYI